MKRMALAVSLLTLLGLAAAVQAATLRPGGDPAKNRIRWADPFDWYNQWAYDNSATWTDSRDAPFGGLHNGPYPPGSPSGAYPTKAPNDGCDTMRQVDPAMHEMVRGMWITTSRHKGYLGTAITTPAGNQVETGEIEASIDAHCGQSGEIATTRGELATATYTWGTGGSYDAMTMFQHSFLDRIQYIDPSKNAVNGTDANPLVLVFYITDGLYPNKDNFYVELSFDGEHAPTDYVWRGDRTKTYPDPDGCPNGPFPIICQQYREINTSSSEDGGDLTWVNQNCPAASTKVWKSLAFGFMAIMDKDPCGILEQGGDVHVPNVEHYAYFDGNLWRQIRSGRAGMNGLSAIPTWDYTLGMGGYDPGMQPGSGPADGFAYPANGGTARVYMKITTDKMMVYVHSDNPAVDYGLTVNRVYQGPFNMISIGVGPGCELDPTTGECKAGASTQALTYSSASAGYNRVSIDSMSIYDGELVGFNPYQGACCATSGVCEDGKLLSECPSPNHWAGGGTSCAATLCCPQIYGDANRDGKVDMVDFAALQDCLTSTVAEHDPVCTCLDAEGDGDVDYNDIVRFSKCANGPGIAGATGDVLDPENPPNTVSCTGQGW